jgi:hypothetical protein
MRNALHLLLVAAAIALLLSGCTKNSPQCGNSICEKEENSGNCPQDCLFETAGNAKQISLLISQATGQPGSVQDINSLSMPPGERISLKEAAALASLDSGSLCYSSGDFSGEELFELSIEYALESSSEKTEQPKISALCMKDLNSLLGLFDSLAISDQAFQTGKIEKCNCTKQPCCAIVLRKEGKTDSNNGQAEKEVPLPCKDLKNLVKSRLGTDCNEAGFSSKADIDGDKLISAKDLEGFEAKKFDENWCTERLALKDTLCAKSPEEQASQSQADVFVKSVSVRDFRMGFSQPCYFDLNAEIGFTGEKAPKSKIQALFRVELDKNNSAFEISEITVDANSSANARLSCKFSGPGQYTASLELFPDENVKDKNSANNRAETKLGITESMIEAKLPDLAFEDFALVPQAVAAGQPFAINYSLKNSGKAPFYSKEFIELKIQVDNNTTIIQVPDLNIEPLGRTILFQYLVGKNSEIKPVKTQGIFKLTATIDPSGKIAERDKNNNNKSLDLNVLGPNAPYNPQACNESDSGLARPEEEIPGGCITPAGVYLADACTSGTDLNEAKCSSSTSCSIATVNCIQAGYDGCRDSACYKNSVPSCNDSDAAMGSASISSKGTCTDSFWPIADSCAEGYLFEAYCLGNYCQEKIVKCQDYGFNACVDGACKNTP